MISADPDQIQTEHEAPDLCTFLLLTILITIICTLSEIDP